MGDKKSTSLGEGRGGTYLFWIGAFAAVAGISATAFYAWQFHGPLSDSREHWGQFGDYDLVPG